MTAAATDAKARPAKKAVQRKFVAEWHDHEKCRAEAIKRGWDPNSGDGYLDIYHPDDDSAGSSFKEFTDLRSAVSFLREVVRKYGTVFGQGDIHEIEITSLAERCRYCTCRGNKAVRRYVVTDDGIEDSETVDNCAN